MSGRAVIGVILQRDKFLTIERSQRVRAPGKICFPGGGVEEGETDEEALVREFMEELGVTVFPKRKIWISSTPRGIQLNWWLAALEANTSLSPNPDEVAEAIWLHPAELARHPQILPSNAEFLEAVFAGKIDVNVEFDWDDASG